MIFSTEIYCCSCQQGVSAEGKGMWIVGRLEVRGRWEPGKDCFLLYPVPRWAQISVFLWHSLPPSLPLSVTAKQTGWCLHRAVTTSPSPWHQLRFFKKIPEWKSSKKTALIYWTIICRKWSGDLSLKFQVEYCWGGLQFSHQRIPKPNILKLLLIVIILLFIYFFFLIINFRHKGKKKEEEVWNFSFGTLQFVAEHLLLK